MTRLATRPRNVQGWVGGLVEAVEPGSVVEGTISEGENFVPTPAGRQRIRGGSRVVQTLNDDAGSPAEIDHVLMLRPFTAVGALAIGWSNAQNKHYGWRLDADMAFSTGTESTSRTDLTASPSTTWDNATDPGRPNVAELFEQMYIADGVTTFTDRNELLGFSQAGTVTLPKFIFGSGVATALQPYCVEEYNSVLFIAGYGSEDAGDGDRPELLRHSFLGRSPDAANGFDNDAFLILGAVGQRVTAMRKGKGLLLVAKENEFFRISGFGRAYDGWQYTVEQVENTQGLGITNPNALTFAEGRWWGVSDQGPIRSDGFSVELLVGPRKPSWRGIDQIENSWVAYHPERRLMLFGLHPTEAESGRSTTYPWDVWAWDMERHVFQPDHKFGFDFFFASAVTTSTVQGPSAGPSSPVTSAETTSGYTASWTNGDATAETEFWEKLEVGGTFTLKTVLAAGVATTPLTGRNDHASYFWRVRHIKGGVPTAFDVDAGTIAQTLILAPNAIATQDGASSIINLALTQNSGGTDFVLERQIDGGGFSTFQTFTSQPSGAFNSTDTTQPCGVVLDYRAKSVDSAWPTTDSGFSATSQVDLTSGCTEE